MGKANPAPPEWKVTPASRVWIGGHSARAKAEVHNRLVDMLRPTAGPIDVAFVAPDSADEAAYFAGKLMPRLTAEGMLWIVLPASESGNTPVVRAVAAVGFSPTDRAGLDTELMSIGFRPRKGADTSSQ